MNIRYLGFEQRQNARVYRFDVRSEGSLTRQVSVTVDMAVFRSHRVGIQEGPSLCASKLTADLEQGCDGEHELTVADVRAYADAKAMADAERASARKAHPRRPAVQTDTQQKSPWRNFGI